jgi:hypothetical protein
MKKAASEDGGSVFLRNVRELLPDYISQKNVLFSQSTPQLNPESLGEA